MNAQNPQATKNQKNESEEQRIRFYVPEVSSLVFKYCGRPVQCIIYDMGDGNEEEGTSEPVIGMFTTPKEDQ